MTRRKGFRGFLADQRGAVAIEFAAIALPLILLLAGTMEISRYTWTRVALQDAASGGARCLGLRLPACFPGGNMDQGATVEFVREQAKGWGIGIAESTVTPDPDAECEGAPDFASFAKIKIRHQFTSVLAVLPETWIEVHACFPATD